MKKLDVLALTQIKQVEWLKSLDSEYLFKAHDGDDLGYTVNFSKDEFNEMLEYPESYGIGEMIQSIDDEMPDQRANEINLGSSLTETEEEYLEYAYIERQMESSEYLHCSGYSVQCEDGIAYAAFSGTGGVVHYAPDLVGIFSSKEDAEVHFNKHPYHNKVE